MASVIVQVASAVTEELNSATFSIPFTAIRHYQPEFELKDLKSLHVTVVPRGVVITTLDRSRSQYDVQIDVAVQKKFSANTLEEIDPLMDFVQEIEDFFKQRSLKTVGAVWVKTENKPVYAPDHMQEYRQFTSVLTLTFKSYR
jgi:hypothetical protein